MMQITNLIADKQAVLFIDKGQCKTDDSVSHVSQFVRSKGVSQKF